MYCLEEIVMKHFLRECLMPGLIIAIVATVWALAWSKELEYKSFKAAKKCAETNPIIQPVEDTEPATSAVIPDAGSCPLAVSDSQ